MTPENLSLLPRVHSIDEEYLTLNICGQGQFSTVWRARRRKSGEIVALKILKPPADGGALLTGEIELLDVAAHPHLVSIHRAASLGDSCFIEMEYCGGQTLETLVSDPAYAEKYSLGDAIGWVTGALEALAFMHAKKISHGDVKPGNLILDPATNQVKLIDLGTSRYMTDDACRTADRTGTWAYQAPEVMLFGERRFTSDIYSVGATLYHLATGRPPYLTIPDLVQQTPVPKPRQLNPPIGGRLEAVVLRAIHPGHQSRYASPREMIADLDGCRVPETAVMPAAMTPGERSDLGVFLFLAKRIGDYYDDVIDRELLDADPRMGLIQDNWGAATPIKESDIAFRDASVEDIGKDLSAFADLADTFGYRKMAIAAYRKLLEEIDRGSVRQMNLGEVLNQLDYLSMNAGVLPAG